MTRAIYKKGRSWYIDYHVKGVRKRKKIGASKQVAEFALAQVQVKIAKGEYLGIYEEKKHTFRQFAPEYLAYSQANKSARSYQRDQGIIETRLMPCFGERFCPISRSARPNSIRHNGDWWWTPSRSTKN